jgi:hypothetical protein
MYLTPKQRKKRVFLHWETWAGFFIAAACAALGSYIGHRFFGHSNLFAAIGGGIGGYVAHLVIGYVERRYYPTSA